MYVYVIYDVEITSIRGIFKTRKEAKNAMATIVGCTVVMKIPVGKIFDGIDEAMLITKQGLSV